MTRIMLLAFAFLVLLATLPATAAPPPAAVATPSSSAQALGAFELPAAAPAPSLTLPDWLAIPQATATTTVFHRFCHCTCSRVPDCNTDADCSNHRCLGAITCC